MLGPDQMYMAMLVRFYIFQELMYILTRESRMCLYYLPIHNFLSALDKAG